MAQSKKRSSGGGGTPTKDFFSLSSTNITNGYVDLSYVSIAKSLVVNLNGSILLESNGDYTVALTGGSGGNTRVTFAGDFAAAGQAPMIANDKLEVQYLR